MVSDPSNTVELKPSILQVGAEFDCCPGREVQVFSAAPAHNGRRRVSEAVATRGTERVGLEPSRLGRLGRFEPGESRRTDWLLLRHFVVKASRDRYFLATGTGMPGILALTAPRWLRLGPQ